MTEQENGFEYAPERASSLVGFDGGEFVQIPYLATSEQGFSVTSHTEHIRGAYPIREIFDDVQLARYRDAIRSDMEFNGAQKVREIRQSIDQARSHGASEEEIVGLTEEKNRRQKAYVEGMMGKVGIREITVEGNRLEAKTKRVPFPAYNEFARPENSLEVLDYSSVLGVAMVLRTTDGRLVVQHRAVSKQRLDADALSPGNASYTDVPGASVAGLYDAERHSEDHLAGLPDPVNGDSVRALILKEAGEELGLERHDMSKLRIVGIARDNIKVHDELLMLTDARLTAAEVTVRSRDSRKNKELGDADFEERFIDIEASPDAIETLLTQVKCPLPPTHAGAMVAAGYSMLLEGEGLAAANAWKERLEDGVKENYRAIDEIVRRYYEKHPTAYGQVPERFWEKNVPQRNPLGFHPSYTPEEQGLPSFEDEMFRTGLNPETRRMTETAYLFDVDGTLTDPKEQRLTDPTLIETLVEKLRRGEPVGLNTGRPTYWAMEHVGRAVVEQVEDPSLLENFIIVGEKGGTWVTFDENGAEHHGRSKQLDIPPEIKDRLNAVVREKYRHVMYVDDERPTMISTILLPGLEPLEYDRYRLEMAQEIARIVEESTATDRLKIDQTTIATDIEGKYVGKALGADRFLEFLKTREIVPRKFVTFGDSPSDIEMAEELDRKNRETVFVYVGPDGVTTGPEGSYEVVHEPGYVAGTKRALGRY